MSPGSQREHYLLSGHRDFLFIPHLLHDRHYIFLDEKVVAR